MVATIATVPAVLRGLGTERFGLLMLMLSVIGSVALLDVGTSMAITKIVAEAAAEGEPKRCSAVVWTGVTLQLGLGLMGASLMTIAAPALASKVLKVPAPFLGETIATLRVVALGAPVTVVAGSFRAVLEGLQRFDCVNLVALPSATAMGLAPFVGLLLGYHLPGIAALLVGIRILSLVCYWRLALRVHPAIGKLAPPDRQSFRSLLAFGGYIAAPNIFRPVTSSIDRVVLTRWVGLAAVAYYGADYDLLRRLGLIASSWASAVFPAFSTLAGAHESERAKHLYEQSTRLLLILLGSLVAFLIVAAQDVIGLWLGRDFAAHAVLPLRILSVGVLLAWIGHVPLVYLRASGYVDVPLKVEASLVPFEVATLYVLTRFWGLIGASIGAAIGLAADPIVMFIVCYRTCAIPDPSRLTKTWIACGLLMVGTTALYLIDGTSWPLGIRLAALAVGAFVMEAAMLRFALEAVERNYLKRIAMSFNNPGRALRELSRAT